MALSSEALLVYMQERLGVDTSDISDATPLFSSNLLDSFSIVELIAFIEAQGEIRVDAWDVSLDNLDSIERILQFVQIKRAG
jgi:acyl carrier protein